MIGLKTNWGKHQTSAKIQTSAHSKIKIKRDFGNIAAKGLIQGIDERQEKL